MHYIFKLTCSYVEVFFFSNIRSNCRIGISPNNIMETKHGLYCRQIIQNAGLKEEINVRNWEESALDGLGFALIYFMIGVETTVQVVFIFPPKAFHQLTGRSLNAKNTRRLSQDTQQKCQMREVKAKSTEEVPFISRRFKMLPKKTKQKRQKRKGVCHVFPIGIFGPWRLCWHLQRPRWQQVAGCLSAGWRICRRKSGGQQCAGCGDSSEAKLAAQTGWLGWLGAWDDGSSIFSRRQFDYRHFDKQVGDTWSGKFPLSIWFSHLSTLAHTHACHRCLIMP